MKPKDINWISDDIKDMIALYKPNSTLLSNNDVDHNVAKDAFMSIFAPKQGSTFVWFNQYQLEQTLRKVAGWYGFAISSSSHTMHCSCGKPHTQKTNKGNSSDDDFQGINDEMESYKKKRNRISVSSIDCPFKIYVTHIKKKDKSLKKIDKPVKVTTFNFDHNHPLNKQMLIKAKMATFQYVIPTEACHTMLNLIKDGPVHPQHVRSFIKRFYPSSQAVNGAMMFNFRLRCKELQNKYGSLSNVPPDKAHSVFDPSSLELAPEHWDTNPIYSQVFKDAMQEVLVGPIDKFNGQITVVKIMEKVKECKDNQFDYRVFCAEDERPAGIMYMTPYQIRQYLRYGDVFALDFQLKRKNKYGQKFCSFIAQSLFWMNCSLFWLYCSLLCSLASLFCFRVALVLLYVLLAA